MSAPRQARAVARLAAVQALYQMEVSGAGVETVVREFRETKDAIEQTAALQRVTNGRLLKAEDAIKELQRESRTTEDAKRSARTQWASVKISVLSAGLSMIGAVLVGYLLGRLH